MARKRVCCERCGAWMFRTNIAQHKQMCVKLPPDDELREVAKTHTIGEMAAMWGVSKTPIQTRLKRMGAKAKDRYDNLLSEEQIATLIEMYNDNYVLYEIEHKLGLSTDRLRLEVKCLIRKKILSPRKTATHPKILYELCKICDMRLDYDCGLPSMGGVCGLCRVEPSLPHDVFVMRNRFLAAAVLRQAMRDSTSDNGHSYCATWWIGREWCKDLFDLTGLSRSATLRQLSQIGQI